MNGNTAFSVDFETALVFANRLHASQLRKGTSVPYISHLMSVAALVLEHGGTRDQAIAGLLHDAIEDQAEDYPGGLEALRSEIASRFGKPVLAIVEACTDATVVPKPPWRERKERYIAHLAHVSDAIRLVSCADKLHNARAIVTDVRLHGDSVWDRFSAGRDGVLWYYRALASEFSRAGPPGIASELELEVSEMEQLARQRATVRP